MTVNLNADLSVDLHADLQQYTMGDLGVKLKAD